MKLKIFSVKDKMAEAFLPPFFLPEIGQATRSFYDCVNDKNHEFGKHPEDYDLYIIGEFDVNKGTIEQKEPLTHVVNGREFKANPQFPDSLLQAGEE